MNFSFIFRYFVPKEKKLFSLFNLSSKNIVESSEQLSKLVISESIVERKSIALIIKSNELKENDITNNILIELNSTFTSSLDSEFVHELPSSLNNVLHQISALSEKIDLYPVTNISNYMKELVSLINQSCIQLQLAVEELENIKNTDKVLKSCIKLDKINFQIDEIRRNAISSLFENIKDPVDLIKQKEILQSIEMTANKIEDVSNIIKTTLVKYA
jgi:uncharacterized protein